MNADVFNQLKDSVKEATTIRKDKKLVVEVYNDGFALVLYNNEGQWLNGFTFDQENYWLENEKDLMEFFKNSFCNIKDVEIEEVM